MSQDSNTLSLTSTENGRTLSVDVSAMPGGFAWIGLQKGDDRMGLGLYPHEVQELKRFFNEKFPVS